MWSEARDVWHSLWRWAQLSWWTHWRTVEANSSMAAGTGCICWGRAHAMHCWSRWRVQVVNRTNVTAAARCIRRRGSQVIWHSLWCTVQVITFATTATWSMGWGGAHAMHCRSWWRVQKVTGMTAAARCMRWRGTQVIWHSHWCIVQDSILATPAARSRWWGCTHAMCCRSRLRVRWAWWGGTKGTWHGHRCRVTGQLTSNARDRQGVSGIASGAQFKLALQFLSQPGTDEEVELMLWVAVIGEKSKLFAVFPWHLTRGGCSGMELKLSGTNSWLAAVAYSQPASIPEHE